MLAGILSLVLLGAAPRLEITGNLVLSEEVYRALLVFPTDLTSEEVATAAVQEIHGFLHRAGYTLARVNATVDGDVVKLDIDEGRLDKVVFRGQGILEAFALQLEQILPFSVYNGLVLERRLKALREKYRLTPFAMELVPLRANEPSRMTIGLDLRLPQSVEQAVEGGGAYELHVLFDPPGWRRGFSLVAAINSIDGFAAGARYRFTDLVFDGDRTEVEGRTGIRAPSPGSVQGPFSRAEARARYLVPPFAGNLRPELFVNTDVVRRQRLDIGVSLYHVFRAAGGVGLEVELGNEGFFTASAGVEDLTLFDLEFTDVRPDVPVDVDRFRYFVQLGLEVDLDADELRLDLNPRLEGNITHYVQPGHAPATKAHADWREVLTYGWHDWLFGVRGDVVFGDALFVEETPLADHLRGVFGDDYSLTVAASFRTEFRYSVRRDRFKIGPFLDVAAFRARSAKGPILGFDAHGNRTVDPDFGIYGGTAFGLGLHGLILDAFQIDMYYGVGFTTEGEFDHGLSARFVQAY